jgi:DNA helicase-2/ATP-dependent DNA helicase PcrA
MEDALRKRNIPYKIFGGLSFYQRKEIKDVLAYLRVIVNPKDEESLKRIINYPARGIGQTTINKLVVGAKQNELSLFQTAERAASLHIGINSGTASKLEQFVILIKSFQIFNETANAFEIADEVTKKTKIVSALKKDGTPEGVSKIENIEELLNGIQDFTEGQNEIADMTGALTEFLEDVALATDFDNENKSEDINRVSLMTIHLAKGLEFPYVYIVGMEEDLFPSPMNLDSRSGLEEERRLFYVAITRAEERAFLSYTQSRYRWGKLNSSEPSRFIEEIDEQYLDHQIPKSDYEFKPLINKSIFGNVDQPKKQYKKPNSWDGKTNKSPTPTQLKKLRKIESENKVTSSSPESLIALPIGTQVEHQRFGKGVVTEVDGVGNDKKATINFKGSGKKKLLLRFAKLKIIE